MKKMAIKIIVLSLVFWTAASTSSYAYSVKRGDNMWRISKKTGVSFYRLVRYNPQIPNPRIIYVGQHINTSRNELVNGIINTAMKYRNVTQYKYGANYNQAPRVADCSSWVKYIYAKNGIWLPRDSRSQANRGTPLTFKQIRRGDLLFYGANNDGRITHVGIFLGNGKWISNLNTNKDVEILSIWGTWSYQHFLWGSRVIPY